MLNRVIPALIATAALCACAGPAPPLRAHSAMRWFLTDAEGEGAKLAYGMPQSDDVLVMLTCQPRSNQVRITLLGQIAYADIELGDGADARRHPATASPAGVTNAVMSESTVSPDDPAFRRFASRGELAIDAGDGTRLPLPAADPATARRFMQSCRA
jgi:hypothetical protein